MTTVLPTIADIGAAAERIRAHVSYTPLKPSRSLSTDGTRNVYLKLESMQPSGSFKIRGAANALLCLTAEERARGVVTCSSGNHGRSLAMVARRLGVPATVFLSEMVPPHKVAAIRELGAQVIVYGADSDAAERQSLRFAEERMLTYVHPFDDPRVIAGQGTIGLEILEQLPEVDCVVIPLSGGGLLGGIARAIKAQKSDATIVGVSMELGPAMVASLEAGRPTAIVEAPTLADALAGDIGGENRYTFPLVQQLIDSTALVSEEQIAAGMVHALLQERIVLEGGGATPIGLMLARPEVVPGRNIVLVCSGDNVDMQVLLRLVQSAAGR